MKIGVIGLGKAGLPLAAVIADSGLEVIGVDIDKNRVDMINNGINPIKEEPGLKELIEKYGGKQLNATTDAVSAARQCHAHIVIVPLFIDENKNPDFSILRKAFENLASGLKKGDLVVLETTVPVGTTEKFVKDILEKGSGLKAGDDFCLAYSPERIMTGYSISRYREFPKLVGGIDAKSTEKAFELYKKFSNPVKVSDSKTAEFAKICEGVYRDVNIALANELYKVCEHYGIDFWEIRKAANHKYCNILEPGNVGGHCIPQYPWFLINNIDVPLIKTARILNDGMINFYFKKIEKIGGKSGKKIGIIGLSYREGVREKAFSRAFDLIKMLKDKGYDVYGIDPLYSQKEIQNQFGIKFLDSLEEMDTIILMNKINQYNNELKKIRNKVIDVKSVLGENKH